MHRSCSGTLAAATESRRILSVLTSPREDGRSIQKAFDENWILITNDKDFGEKVYREQHPHRGIALLRLEDERTASKIDALQSLLRDYSERIPGSFVVVTETGVRFAGG